MSRFEFITKILPKLSGPCKAEAEEHLDTMKETVVSRKRKRSEKPVPMVSMAVLTKLLTIVEMPYKGSTELRVAVMETPNAALNKVKATMPQFGTRAEMLSIIDSSELYRNVKTRLVNQVLGAQMEETLKQFRRLSTSYYNTLMDYHFGLTKLQMLENILILWPTKVAKKTLDKIFSDDDREREKVFKLMVFHVLRTMPQIMDY